MLKTLFFQLFRSIKLSFYLPFLPTFFVSYETITLITSQKYRLEVEKKIKYWWIQNLSLEYVSMHRYFFRHMLTYYSLALWSILWIWCSLEVQLHYDGNLLSISNLFFWNFIYFIKISAYWSLSINSNINVITIILVSCTAHGSIILVLLIITYIDRQAYLNIAAKLGHSFCQ